MTAPYRNVRLGPSDMVIERRPDGSTLARSPHPLDDSNTTLLDRLDHWARRASYRTFLAQRDSQGRWRNVTYAEAQYFAKRIAQALLDRGLSVERPVVIVSGNTIEHALLAIGAMIAGVPYASLSPSLSPALSPSLSPVSAPVATQPSNSPDSATSLQRFSNAADPSELEAILALLDPGLLFFHDDTSFNSAWREAASSHAEAVVHLNPPARTTPLADLVNTEPKPSVDLARSHVHAGTVVKLLFKRGFAKSPMGVAVTHRMWANSQEMLRCSFPFLGDAPPIIVDGFPWSEEFGGNTSLGMTLYNGGSLYIDGAPGSLVDSDIRKVAPTIYANTLEGFAELLPVLQGDSLFSKRFSKRFFSRLQFLYCIEPVPSTDLIEAFESVAVQACEERLAMGVGWGAPETTGPILFGRPGASGSLFPAPGVELKLMRTDQSDVYEARFRGPNITFGYWRQPAATRAIFDEEGYLRLGTRLRFASAEDPQRGFVVESSYCS